jgi:NAD(P)-dependent dehydrogenase (short-subunit alcohol dehydrogenase family)
VKTLFITGGTGDLGHAVVRHLSRDYRCVVLYRSESSLNELRSAIGTTIEGAASADEVTGNVYGLVLLAGGFKMGSSPETFQSMLDANLLSAARTVESLQSKIEDGGRVVAISSAASITRPAGLGAYVASKAALNAYLQSVARELQPRKICVNALLPETLDTPTMRKTMSRDLLVPLARVAETIAFFLSDAAGSITGQLVELSR